MSHLHTAPHQSDSPAPVAVGAPVEATHTEMSAEANADDKPMGSTPEDATGVGWTADGLAELKKIPFFVRGKVKRNTEKFACDRGISSITVDTLYEAKAAIGK